MTLLILVQLIQIHHLDQQLILDRIGIDIVGISTHTVVEVLYLHREVVLLQRADSQRIDVFHHQIPEFVLRITRGTFQQLDKKCASGIFCIVAGKFAYLISLTAFGILESHCQRAVIINLASQRDVT